VKYGFSELMQIIFKYCNIHNTSLTPDKELIFLIYVITYRNYTLLKWSGLWPILYRALVRC